MNYIRWVMRRHFTFTRVIGVLITLTLLLVVVVGAARGGEEAQEPSESISFATGDVERSRDTALVCLALVGGTVLLAGSVWMGQMRRMLS